MFSTTFNDEAKLWSGRNILPLYNERISVADVLFNAMTKYGSKIAQISDNNGIQLSFDEIRMQTIRVAQNLQTIGYKPSQVFGIIAKNYHNIAPVVFASIAIGCPINTLDPSFGKTQLLHMLKTTKPVLVFCDIDCYELVKECLKDMENDVKFEIFTLGGSKDGSQPIENLFAETKREEKFLPTKVDGINDIAAILCSSGTTGLSKGVCLSHAAILEAITQVNLPVSTNDVTLCFSSLYWISGLFTLIRGTITGTTRLITTDPFTPELQLRFIEKYKVTNTLNSPFHITLLLKSDRFRGTDLTSLKCVLIGGSKVPHHIKVEMNNSLPPTGSAHVVYGLSEIAGLLSIDHPVRLDKDTIGKLIGGSHVKIIDDDGKRCGVNIDGEICIKSNYKFIGYYNNRKETDELFDGEGFLKTGDIGHFDEDGDLFVVDRKKDMLKYCNFQISPSEIDAVLTESPDIKSACIVGIPHSEVGDMLAAVIVRAEGSNITEDQIIHMVAENFAPNENYKIRGGVYFVDSLPTTPSGKLLRREAKQLAIEMYNARSK